MGRQFSGRRLQAARLTAGLTSDQVAAYIGRSPWTLHNYEHGRHTPTAAVIGALADALAVPVDALYAHDGPTPARPALGDPDARPAAPYSVSATVSEVADRLGRSSGHVRRLCRLGQLPARRTGRVWLIDQRAVPPRRRAIGAAGS